MGYVASGRNQIKNTDNVIPDAAQTPTAHTHFKSLADALEARSVLRLTTIGMATTPPESLNPLQDGMMVVATTDGKVYVRVAGAWQKVWKMVHNGTAVPAASLGDDGDIYVQYV